MKDALRLMVAVLVLGLAACATAETRRVALLVGISKYADGALPRLEGPEHDVASIRSVLVRRWRFHAENIRTLVNEQATRAAILKELDQLRSRSGTGDEVVIYFSGHGMSALMDSVVPELPHGTGAFVPYDYRDDASDLLASLIVGQRDLRPLIARLESDGRRLWVISDSCFSGQQVRRRTGGGGASLPTRLLPAPKAALRDAIARFRSHGELPVAYPYLRTTYLSASAEGEVAKDISKAHLVAYPTLDGKPHGAFTDALLRVLEGQIPADYDRDGWMSLNEVHRAVSEFMASRSLGHSPQRLPSIADDRSGLGALPVLTVQGVAAAPRESGPRPLRVAGAAAPGPLRLQIGGLPDVLAVTEGTDFDIAVKADASALALVAASGDVVATRPLSEGDQIVAQVRQLAWARRIDQMAQRGRRGALPVETEPSRFGGNVEFGTTVSFALRPDRTATVLLINIDAEGRISVLYPFRSDELEAFPPMRPISLPGPGKGIRVTRPEGLDMQLAWAFDSRPEGLEQLVGLVTSDASSAPWQTLERILVAMAGQYTYAKTELRAFQPR